MKAINLFVAVLLLASNAGAADALTERLQRGLFEEEANRNLDAAIKEYQAVVAQSDEQRNVTATALFRLGECYRKLGKTNEAAAFYQRIVRDFSEQEQLVKLSRSMMVASGAAIIERGATSDSELVRELERRLARLQGELSEVRTRFKVMNSMPRDELLQGSLLSDSVLADLQQQLRKSEQHEAEHKNDSGLVQQEQNIQKRVNEQIVERLKATLVSRRNEADVLSAQVDALALELEKARGTSARLPEASNASALTQAEAEELARVKTLARNSPDLLRTPVKGQAGGMTELQRAANSGYASAVEFLLAQGVSPNDPVSGYSPLDLAALRGNLRIVQLLLDKGATPQDASEALNSAAANGFKAVAELLIARGADVNHRREGNLTALHATANKSQTALVELLLRHGAKPDVLADRTSSGTDWPQVMYEGATPLHLAAARTNEAIVKLLLDAGAAAAATNYFGNTPLHLAAYAGNTNTIALLLARGANPNAITSYGDIVLSGGIASGRAAVVAQLLRAGADVNLPGRHSNAEAPLIEATQRGVLEVVNAVLNAKPDVEATNHLGDTALLWAVKSRNDKLAELLLQAGANPSRTDAREYPALRLALNGSAPLVELLLNHGANPNVVNDGETPLSVVLRLISSPPPASPTPPTLLGQASPPDRKAEWQQMAAALRQHRADEFLQRRGFISAVRGPEQRVNIFSKGTNDVNRYTLMEFLAAVYEKGGKDFHFPDLEKIIIHRIATWKGPMTNLPPGVNSVNAIATVNTKTPILVNLAALLAATNCAADLAFEWGDEVEIPMADHPVRADWFGLVYEAGRANAQAAALGVCLQRTVRFTAGGTNVAIPLFADIGDTRSGGTLARGPFFRLSSVVLRDNRFRNLLRSSSDLSRVTVTRPDPQTKETKKMTFDLNAVALPDMSYSGTPPPIPWAHDLWLRDGDVIEVPEKP